MVALQENIPTDPSVLSYKDVLLNKSSDDLEKDKNDPPPKMSEVSTLPLDGKFIITSFASSDATCSDSSLSSTARHGGLYPHMRRPKYKEGDGTSHPSHSPKKYDHTISSTGKDSKAKRRKKNAEKRKKRKEKKEKNDMHVIEQYAKNNAALLGSTIRKGSPTIKAGTNNVHKIKRKIYNNNNKQDAPNRKDGRSSTSYSNKHFEGGASNTKNSRQLYVHNGPPSNNNDISRKSKKRRKRKKKRAAVPGTTTGNRPKRPPNAKDIAPTNQPKKEKTRISLLNIHKSISNSISNSINSISSIGSNLWRQGLRSKPQHSTKQQQQDINIESIKNSSPKLNIKQSPVSEPTSPIMTSKLKSNINPKYNSTSSSFPKSNDKPQEQSSRRTVRHSKSRDMSQEQSSRRTVGSDEARPYRHAKTNSGMAGQQRPVPPTSTDQDHEHVIRRKTHPISSRNEIPLGIQRVKASTAPLTKEEVGPVTKIAPPHRSNDLGTGQLSRASGYVHNLLLNHSHNPSLTQEDTSLVSRQLTDGVQTNGVRVGQAEDPPPPTTPGIYNLGGWIKLRGNELNNDENGRLIMHHSRSFDALSNNVCAVAQANSAEMDSSRGATRASSFDANWSHHTSFSSSPSLLATRSPATAERHQIPTIINNGASSMCNNIGSTDYDSDQSDPSENPPPLLMRGRKVASENDIGIGKS